MTLGTAGYTEGSGKNFSIDTVGGADYQRLKLVYGPVGTIVDVCDATPFPISPGASATIVGWDRFINTDVKATLKTVKAALGNLVKIKAANPNPRTIFVQVFDNASPTVGTTPPDWVLEVPSGNGDDVWGVYDELMPGPVKFSNAIKLAATTTPTGSTAPDTGLVVCALYK